MFQKDSSTKTPEHTVKQVSPECVVQKYMRGGYSNYDDYRRDFKRAMGFSVPQEAKKNKKK